MIIMVIIHNIRLKPGGHNIKASLLSEIWKTKSFISNYQRNITGESIFDIELCYMKNFSWEL